MTTTALPNPSTRRPAHGAANARLSLIQRLGRGVLVFLIALIALLTGLPILLLFFVTAVPVWIAVLLTLADGGLLLALLRLERTVLSTLGSAAGWVIIAMLAVILSQQFASTPRIDDGNGAPLPGSIAALEQVELNGSQQWITIRGRDIDNPVLLFLAGGPGGSELVMTRRYLGALEEHFVIVNWDQPGTGKSYNAVPFEQLTLERYIDDAYALTRYLQERFHQDKIYVFGESWGSILGMLLIEQHPELYYALVTTGQMVDPVENDTLGYELAIELLTEQGRLEDAEGLRRNGAPPYRSDELIGKFSAINNVLNAYMESHAHGEGTGHNLMLDSLGAQEYGLLDKVYWLLGLARTFTTVYPQLDNLDLRTEVPRVEVPVYFVRGRWDVNAVNSLAEEYFAMLEAPHKEWIWFENSAHTPSWDEPTHFVDVMINTVLAQTLPPPPDTSTFSGYFDAQIPAYLREYNIVGAAVAVVENGTPVHLTGYGSANLEQHMPLDATSSLMHIGSAGKTFTAVAIMQLVERGLLDLDADVNAYLDFAIPATFAQPITIRHLLTHTSGFEAHDLGIMTVDAGRLPEMRAYLVGNMPARVRPPGAAIGYSNYGLALLGYVVERVAGMSLSDYLEANVLDLLSMTHSSAQIVPPANLNEHLAIGYSARNAQPPEYVAAFGAAPIRSTAADMANYMIAHLQFGRFGEAQILQAETARAMQTQQFSAAPGLNGIGFGFYEFSRNGQRILGHLGTTTNFHTLMLLFPEHDLGVFVSFNSAEGGQVLRSGRFLDDLLNQFFPDTVTAIVPPADFAQHAGDYSGTYFWNNRFGQTTMEKLLLLPEAVTIRPTEDNRLRVESGGIGHTFTETEPDTFVRSDGHDVLVFHRDEAGRVTSASLNSRAVFTLERRAWYESPLFTLVGLGIAGILLLAGLVMAGLHLRQTNNVAGWSALLMPLLNIAFVVGFAALLPSLMHGTGSDTLLRVILLLPMIALALTLVLAGATMVEWLRGTSTLALRVEHTVLFAAGLLFAIVLSIWNLLGWRL